MVMKFTTSASLFFFVDFLRTPKVALAQFARLYECIMQAYGDPEKGVMNLWLLLEAAAKRGVGICGWGND
jgi:hypothetical protein